MPHYDGFAERIEAGRLAKGWTKAQLCAAAGLPEQRYTTIVRHGSLRYLERVAHAFAVHVEWLTTGAHPPPWYRPGMGLKTAKEHALAAAKLEAKRGKRDRRRTKASIAEERERKRNLLAVSIPVIGTVTAGAGWAEPSQDPDDSQPISIPAHWRAVKIQGDSGYPVVWDRQTVLVDDSLPIKHNRLVVVQTEDRRAYIKRYCICSDVPAGFVLASVNIGRDSFALPAGQHVRMSVVVGVLFTDSAVA